MQNAGAVKMLVQDASLAQTLADSLTELSNSPDTIVSMENAARKLARADAAEATVDIIEELARD